jgi:OOP family OmpA-OmpF porin
VFRIRSDANRETASLFNYFSSRIAMIKKIIAAALATVALSAHAAEPNPFYVGADLGATKMERWSDAKESSYGMFAGYTINQNFAVEAGWRRLYDNSGFGWSRGDQTSLSLIGSVPLVDKLSIYGRLGASHLQTKYTDSSGGGFHADMTRTLYGVGLNYKFNEKVSARLEVQRPGDDMTNMSAGVSFAF